MAAGTALGSGGSAYVTSGCDYTKSLQDNTIVQGDFVYVWVKEIGNGFGDLTWRAVANPGAHTALGSLIPVACSTFGPKYVLYLAGDAIPVLLGSWTLTVWDGDSPVSGDGFRVIAP